MISIEEFKKMDLRVAEIVKVEEIKGADKLWKLTINIGNEEKQIVSGIKDQYSKEDLINKQIIVINNLQPAKIRGVDSNGMLLAAIDDGEPVLLIPDRKVKAGSKVS